MEVNDPPIIEEAVNIHRSRGSTASERLLADLGEQAFLNLWSYPNLFYDKKKNGKGDGKELCDMLVVCGDDVITFSDKHIKLSTIRTPRALAEDWAQSSSAPINRPPSSI